MISTAVEEFDFGLFWDFEQKIWKTFLEGPPLKIKLAQNFSEHFPKKSYVSMQPIITVTYYNSIRFCY